MINYYINGTRVEVGQVWVDSEGEEQTIFKLKKLDSKYPVCTDNRCDLKTWTAHGWMWNDESGDKNKRHLSHLKQQPEKERQ